LQGNISLNFNGKRRLRPILLRFAVNITFHYFMRSYIMAAHHRANRKTLETVYRVYRLPDDLRKRVKAKREKANVTLQAVIEAASLESLPKIVNTLKTMGLGFDGKKRPARLPMTDSLLGAFKVASKQTGVPASRLLQAALTLTCKGTK
jgi:hypothetical protein